MGRWVCVVWGSIGDGVFVRSYGQDMLCFRSYPHKSTGVSDITLGLCCVDLFFLEKRGWAWCFKLSIILCAFIVMFWTADLLCGMNQAALHVSRSHFRSYNLVFFSGRAFCILPHLVETKAQCLFTAHLTSLLHNHCIDRSDTANSSKYKSSMQWQTIGFNGFFPQPLVGFLVFLRDSSRDDTVSDGPLLWSRLQNYIKFDTVGRGLILKTLVIPWLFL